MSTAKTAQTGTNGKDGVDGSKGDKGEKGETGATGNGIAKVEKTSTEGLVDTYTITFTDNTTTTFTIVNGANGINGEDGKDGKDGIDGVKGDDGNGIASIAKTGTEGLVDTYTINFTNGEHATFTVTNGAKGADGANGTNGTNGLDGADGVSITGASLNDQGELVLVLSAGDPINVGKVVGANGTNGTNGNDGKDGKDGADGVSVTGARIENGELILTIGEVDHNLGNVKGADGADGTNGTNGTNGADGVSIVAVEIGEDGHLYVTLSSSETPVDCGAIKDVHAHNFGDWIVLKDATCTEKGLRSHVCSICGAVVGEEIPKTAHEYVDGVCEICHAEQQFTATFKADDVVVAEIPFTVSTVSLEEPTVPAKDGYNGVWEAYTLGTSNIEINAVYTEIPIIEISTVEQLSAIAGSSDRFALVNNIDFETGTWNAVSSFTGVLDGRGYQISNVQIQGGAFVLSNSGTIRNLTFYNALVRGGSDYAGTIAATNSGVIEDCVVTNGNINTTAACIGGLVGYNTGTIRRSASSSTVKCTNKVSDVVIVGGLVGKSIGTAQTNASIEQCYADGGAILQSSRVTDVDVVRDVYVGGLIGRSENTQVQNCYSAGEVYCTYNVTTDNDATIAVTINIGGVVGYAESGTFENCFSVCTEYASNTTTSQTTTVNKGGFAGNNGTTATNCYRNEDFVCSEGATLGTAESVATMKTASFVYTTLGWSNEIWTATDGNLPTLK